MSTRPLFLASIWTAVISAATFASACNGIIVEGQAVPTDPPPPVLSGQVPLPGRYLDHSPNLDLVNGVFPPENLGGDGKPFRAGTLEHPLIREARIYARTIAEHAASLPSLGSGELTNPATLDAWKHLYKIPVRQPSEPLAGYRRANNVVVYYNKNELGLGRELGCGTFDDGNGWGTACYVTNYGFRFNDRQGSMKAAEEQLKPRNTVCILYQPSMPEQQQVQFFVFDGDGNRQEWAQLDSMGPRPHPQICTNCHGGSYDDTTHLVSGAHFLPLDPDLVDFGTAPHDRASQENAIHAVNAIAFDTTVFTDSDDDGHFDARTTRGNTSSQRLTAEQSANIWRMYFIPGQQDIYSMGATAGSVGRPMGWISDDATQDQRVGDLYAKVVYPYCATCHNAVGPGLLRARFAFAGGFLADGAMKAAVCTSSAYSMPNAQATMNQMWEHDDGPITINGTPYATPADALLVAGFGLAGRASCESYENRSNCASTGTSDHALCGNDHSGTACSGVANGACVPDPYIAPVPTMPTVWFERQSFSAPTGICQTNGPRGCPSGQTCTPSDSTVTGLADFDGVCTMCGGPAQLTCQ
jgi:hypothetical protein